LVKPDAVLRIRCAAAPLHFNKLRWKVSDTGSGLHEKQLDLYWGEDDPLGTGKRLTQPKGFDCDLINPTVLVLEASR
jgi:hypothetical protein